MAGEGALISPTFTLALGAAVLPGAVACGRFEGEGAACLACATSGGRVMLVGGSGGVAGGVRLLNINKTVTALACGRLPVPPTPLTALAGAGGGPLGSAEGGSTGGSSLPPVAGGGSSAFAPVGGAPPPSSSWQGVGAAAAAASERDVLLVGTGASLQAYDVGGNRDIFFKDVPEAVTALAAGPWASVPEGGGGSGGGGAGGASGSNSRRSSASTASNALVFAGGNCTLTGFGGGGREVVWGVAGDVVTALAFADVDGETNGAGRRG